MRVIIEAINAPPLYHEVGTAAILRAEAIKGFTTLDGQFVPPSNVNALYLDVPITIVANVPVIPSFEIDSTEDCTPWDSAITGDVPGYRFSIITSRGKKIPYFPQCKIPVLTGADTSFNWNELRLYNRNFHRRFTALDRMINVDQVLAWIQDALGSRGYASETNVGLAAAQDDPIDPSFPVFLGPNSPGVTRASGLATLVAGEKLVASDAVTATCGIQLTGQDDGAIGPLRVSSKVNGVSFTITSFNEADDGVVFWEIIEP